MSCHFAIGAKIVLEAPQASFRPAHSPKLALQEESGVALLAAGASMAEHALMSECWSGTSGTLLAQSDASIKTISVWPLSGKCFNEFKFTH